MKHQSDKPHLDSRKLIEIGERCRALDRLFRRVVEFDNDEDIHKAARAFVVATSIDGFRKASPAVLIAESALRTVQDVSVEHYFGEIDFGDAVLVARAIFVAEGRVLQAVGQISQVQQVV